MALRRKPVASIPKPKPESRKVLVRRRVLRRKIGEALKTTGTPVFKPVVPAVIDKQVDHSKAVIVAAETDVAFMFPDDEQ